MYKALSVLEFLIKRGSDGAVMRAKDSTILQRLEYLKGFAYITPDSRDVGANVQHRARVICALLHDERRLSDEREKGTAQRKRMAEFDRGQHTNQQQQWNPPVGELHSGEDANGKHGSLGSLPPQQQQNESEGNQEGTASGTVAAAIQLPNAGETKGISQEANARHLSALKKLLALPENALCADCALPGPGHRPTWASVSLGVFMCMRCAGVHRGLGVHVSQVRSCSLDMWHQDQVEFMAGCGGNATANQFWEAHLPDSGRPSVGTLSDLDSFLERKYIGKEFADQDGIWPPAEPFEDSRVRSILDDLLTEEEKEARAAERAAAAAAKDVAEGNVAEASLDSAEVAQQPPPLINLLDLDFAPALQMVGSSMPPAGVDPCLSQGDIDPFAALEKVFSEETTEGGNQMAKKDRLFSAQPQNIDAWDMQSVLITAQQAAQQNAEGEDSSPSKSTGLSLSAYHPPWAPTPLQLPDPGTESVDAFGAAFVSVPHQFTSNPVVTPTISGAQGQLWSGPVPLSEAGSSIQAGFTTNGSSAEAQLPSKPARPLEPHEMRAQQLILGVLDSFDAKANLLAVKHSPTTLGAAVGAPPSLKQLKSPT